MVYTREKFRRIAPPGDDYLIRRIEALEREVAQTRSARHVETGYTWAENGAMSVPTAWTDLGYGTVSAPQNFLGGHFLMVVSVGDSFTTTGTVSAQPFIEFVGPSGSAKYYGPALAATSGSASVATTFWASDFFIPAAQAVAATDLRFGVRGVRAGAELAPTTGNWHVAASVIFRRGG